MDCTCKEWLEYEPKITGIIMFANTHGVNYNGLSYKYCPWCGKELIAEQESAD